MEAGDVTALPPSVSKMKTARMIKKIPFHTSCFPVSKGTTFHTLRREQKKQETQHEVFVPAVFCLNIYILYLFALKMHTLNT